MHRFNFKTSLAKIQLTLLKPHPHSQSTPFLAPLRGVGAMRVGGEMGDKYTHIGVV